MHIKLLPAKFFQHAKRESRGAHASAGEGRQGFGVVQGLVNGILRSLRAGTQDLQYSLSPGLL